MTYRWLETFVAPFLSFDGAVVGFSGFSGLAALSVEEGFREGGLGFGGEVWEVVVSSLGLNVAVPFVD